MFSEIVFKVKWIIIYVNAKLDYHSDSFDFDLDEKPSSLKNELNQTEPNSAQDNSIREDEDDNKTDDVDDFFAADNKVSAEDIFTKVQNEKKKGRKQHFVDDDDDDMPYNNKHSKPDKSRGFKTQNQSKREYRNYQSRQKRQKFGY